MRITAHPFVGVLLVALSGLFTTGCQSGCTGDPRSDNYWCARQNLNSGTYARQTNELRSIASTRQSEEAGMRNRLNALQSQLSAARAANASGPDVQRLEAEISSLKSQIRGLKSGI